jgi:hypothetical protein
MWLDPAVEEEDDEDWDREQKSPPVSGGQVHPEAAHVPPFWHG